MDYRIVYSLKLSKRIVSEMILAYDLLKWKPKKEC